MWHGGIQISEVERHNNAVDQTTDDTRRAASALHLPAAAVWQ
jgi:hypothetical protein